MSATLAPPATTTQCVTCHTPLQGTFCHACGEKRLDHHDYSLAHFLEHAVDTSTHFDFKVVKGAWDLLRHPGRMTADVLAGRRVPWPKPLQLFLVVNVVFVFAAHRLKLQIFNTPWRYHVDNWYGNWAAERMRGLAERRGTTVEQLAEQFNASANVLSKTLIFAFIPLLAVLLTALFWRRRRYFLEHVVTATHLISQILLVELVMIPPGTLLIWLINRFASHPLGFGNRDLVATSIITLSIAVWSAALLRRTYGSGKLAAAARGLAVGIGFFWLLINVYRLLLFVVTYCFL
ncbi:DUF3667 domain-containing protein [Hymenobacter busanensis]|uniref:DUF3667 domain-containing protein n=1 Tax=Hymenobacter busanensis TaxID=2607656 RepID=A0A7L4ZVQ2_9BACT|nr:DUF3667 domain-containing protein [Hymenobacter busanensis]KAA9339131.1 DUF3667 domain-containing protein [Hymenobacter busanensis]QHJ07107.1 DUF3667 domain-containing protein [Hymenobacter busanensis]